MESGLDDRLIELRDLGHQVGRMFVEPGVARRDQHAGWDHSLFTAVVRAGIPGAALRGGGRGSGLLGTVLLLEGFGAGSWDMGLSWAVAVHGVLCGVSVALLGSEVQRQRYSVRTSQAGQLGAVAPSSVDILTGEEIRAHRDQRGWWLDGHLQAVVNAPEADHFLVIAADSGGGRTALLVDHDAPGLSVRAEAEPVALRTCRTGELVLDGCRVPADAVLGTPGAAGTELVPLLATLERTCLMAPWLGLVREMSERMVNLVAGRPSLARSQSVRMAVADLCARTEMSADLLYRAAWRTGALDRPPREDSAMAKLFLIETLATVVGTAAMVEELSPRALPTPALRDALHYAASSGGAAVLRSVVADSVLRNG